MKSLIIMILISLSSGIMAAEQPTDFAYGAALEADGSEALYEVILPAALYRGVARSDLGDVRVFNGADEIVPYALRPRRTASADAPAPLALTLFPLKAQTGTSIEGLSISVQRGAGGAASINVTSSGGSGGEKRTVGYLVDLSAQERALRNIEFDWQAVADGFAGKLRIDASDDLASWRTLVAAAPLVSLEVAGQKLEQKRVELPRQKMKYLRLSWLPQKGGAALPELISARGEPASQSVEANREWEKAVAAKGEKPGEFIYDLRGHFPVDRVRLDLPEPNTVVQVELLARDRADQPWRFVARGVAYRLRQGGGEIASPELTLATTTDRYWLLRIDQRGGGVGSGAPGLEAGWVPQRLVFAARGKPPFQLAYGNREAKPASLAISTLIPGYKEDSDAAIRSAKPAAQQTVNVKSAQALAQQELGGEARREAAVDWKRWSLWGALLLGVIILGAMAWRLARQLSSPRASSSRDATNQE